LNKTEKKERKTAASLNFVEQHPEIFGACTECNAKGTDPGGNVYRQCASAEGHQVYCTKSKVGYVFPQPAGTTCHRIERRSIHRALEALTK
jgi:hypothetical protein